MEEKVCSLDILKQLISDQNLEKLAFWYSRDNILDEILATDVDLLSFLFRLTETNTCAKTMLGYLSYKGILLKKKTGLKLYNGLQIQSQTNILIILHNFLLVLLVGFTRTQNIQ